MTISVSTVAFYVDARLSADELTRVWISSAIGLEANTNRQIPGSDERMDCIRFIPCCDGFIGDVASEWLAVVALHWSFRPILRLGDRCDD
jgi:hypothetical protein